jgi:hypothetical protein
MVGFETWPLCHVGQIVEAGQASATLLADIRAEFEASREKAMEQSHADAVQQIALQLAMPVEIVENGLAALEAQPRLIAKCSYAGFPR